MELAELIFSSTTLLHCYFLFLFEVTALVRNKKFGWYILVRNARTYINKIFRKSEKTCFFTQKHIWNGFVHNFNNNKNNSYGFGCQYLRYTYIINFICRISGTGDAILCLIKILLEGKRTYFRNMKQQLFYQWRWNFSNSVKKSIRLLKWNP